MSETLTANLAERLDDQTIEHVRAEVAHASHDAIPDSTAELPRGKLSRALEQTLAKRLAQRHVAKLLENRGRVAAAWRALPERMHFVANQTKLMMELVDDFRTGAYRKVPWRSLAVCAGAIVYVANPADVVPDIISGLGLLDDIAVAAFAARIVRRDLETYCQWKGYATREYFAN